MPKPSTSDIEKRLSKLAGDDTEPLEIRITDHLVMAREQAEREDREILGPAEDTPPENDCVRVADPRSDSTVIRVEP